MPAGCPSARHSAGCLLRHTEIWVTLRITRKSVYLISTLHVKHHWERHRGEMALIFTHIFTLWSMFTHNMFTLECNWMMIRLLQHLTLRQRTMAWFLLSNGHSSVQTMHRTAEPSSPEADVNINSAGLLSETTKQLQGAQCGWSQHSWGITWFWGTQADLLGLCSNPRLCHLQTESLLSRTFCSFCPTSWWGVCIWAQGDGVHMHVRGGCLPFAHETYTPTPGVQQLKPESQSCSFDSNCDLQVKPSVFMLHKHKHSRFSSGQQGKG